MESGARGMKVSSKQPIKIHRPRVSSTEHEEEEVEFTDILTSGLRLGGVWMDHFKQRVVLEETVGRQREVLQFTIEDRDTLQWERRFWVERFKANAASLSHTELSHLEAQQIIDVVKSEKKALDGKCLSLESQREWLEKERTLLKKQIEDNNTAMKLSALKVADFDSTIKNQVDENKVLQDIIYSKDDQIDALKRRLATKDEELEVLKHSAATKDRQVLAVVKERDRLRAENEAMKKKLVRTKVPPETAAATPDRPEDKASPQFSRAASKVTSPTDVASFSTPLSSKSIAVDIPSSQETGFRLDELLQFPAKSGFDMKERSYLSIIHKLQQDLKVAQGRPRSEVVVNTKLLRSSGKSTPVSAPISSSLHRGLATPLSTPSKDSCTPTSARRVARALFADEQPPWACTSPPRSPTKMSLRREKAIETS